jgi:hypothetical protein
MQVKKQVPSQELAFLLKDYFLDSAIAVATFGGTMA